MSGSESSRYIRRRMQINLNIITIAQPEIEEKLFSFPALTALPLESLFCGLAATCVKDVKGY